jgi:hypothetical protein
MSLRYWRRRERDALLRRLEMAVEAGVLRYPEFAMESWNREVPRWWRWSRMAHVRFCCAWDRWLRNRYDFLKDPRR